MLKNFVEESCTGTGDLITLTGATVGNITFLKSLKTGQFINYVIEDLSTSVKVSGIGIFNAANNTILRSDRWQFDGTNVIDNPISNITLSGATHRIRCDITAESTEILSRIDDSITATAKAVYIYDTSKDTIDWRHNENASWYNEPLNTATRGATREFPATPLIIVETNKIIFYDATNPLLPMWRVFNTVAWQGFGSFNSISCKNGIIYLTANQNDGIYGDLQIIDFINDEVSVIDSSGAHIKNTGSSIADSNIVGTAYIYISTTTKLIHNTALKVAIATLKDGTDAIYVATQAGLTRIASDGSVSYWNDLGNATSYVASVAINDDNVFFNVWSNQDAVRIISQPVNAPLVNTASTTGMAYSGLNSDAHTNSLTPLHVAGQNALSFRVAEKALFSAKGLYLINPNSSSYGLGLHATITSSFNSGYQYGDIKGAWLADTVAESITATDLVTNGTFTTNTDWVLGTGVTISTGLLNFATTATASALQPVSNSYVVGKSYQLSITVTAITAGKIRLQAYFAGSSYIDITTAGTYTLNVVAQAVDTINVWCLGATTATVDNVTMVEVVGDRSYNNSSLTINGTLTKTAVNTGCELVGYSGFSGTNYLSHPHDARFDFGTGDFNLSLWFSNTDSSANDKRMINYWQADLLNNGNRLDILKQGASSSISVNVGVSVINLPISLTDTSYRKLNVVRKAGVLYGYIDNQLLAQAVSADSVGAATFTLFVGQLASLTQAWVGGLVLFHIGAGAPTREKIAEAYNEEKHLFNPNTACTLAGTGDDCKAVDYDSAKDLHHVATTTNKSVFKGLVRVSSKVGAFTTVSAQNDYVAEA